MFVCKAIALAEFLESCVVFSIRNNFNRKVSIYFNPLRPFSPLIQCDLWVVAFAVSATPNSAWIVVDLHKSLVGVYEVRVDCGEVEEGDARF